LEENRSNATETNTTERNITSVIIEDIVDTGKSRQVGRGWEHLKLSITDGRDETGEYEAIAFNMGHLFSDIHKGKAFDLCFSIEENVYRGVSSMQFMVRDIRFQ